jgi:hypothetical protein
MTTNIIPMLAMHGRLAGRGLLLLMVIAVCALIIASWPSKTQMK